MATYQILQQKRVAIGMEGTYGVFGTMARYIPCEAVMDYKLDSVIRPLVGGNRADVQTYKKEGVLTPKITMSVEPDGVGEILKSFFGTSTVASVGTIAYTHNFYPTRIISDAFNSCSVKLDFGNSVVYDYRGLRGNKIIFDFKPKADIKLTCDFIGQTEWGTGTSQATLAYGTYQPMIFSQANVNIDGTAVNPLNMTIEMSNGLADGFRVGTSADTIRPLPKEAFKASIKFDLEFTGTMERNRYMQGSYMPIDIKVSGDTLYGTAKTELRFAFPKVNYMSAPFTTAEGLQALTITGQILEGTASIGTSAVNVWLQNYTAAY